MKCLTKYDVALGDVDGHQYKNLSHQKLLLCKNPHKLPGRSLH